MVEEQVSESKIKGNQIRAGFKVIGKYIIRFILYTYK
jgi:hypothetical protein